MHDATGWEALHCLTRTELERLQVYSRYLRELVNHYAHCLPLRHIYCVSVFRGNVYLNLRWGGGTDIELKVTQRNLDELFHRVNNASVERLRVSFGPPSRQFLVYIRANAPRLRCRIKTLHHVAGSVDYAMVDFIGRRLRPRVFEARTNDEIHKDSVIVFDCNALRASVSHLVYRRIGTPPPHYIIPELLRCDALKSCAVTLYIDPRRWISNFVEAFAKIAPGTRTVHTVTLLHLRNERACPLMDTVDPLGPTPGIVKTPRCAFIQEWCRHEELASQTTTESATAKLATFVNVQAQKRANLFMCLPTQNDHPGPRGVQAGGIVQERFDESALPHEGKLYVSKFDSLERASIHARVQRPRDLTMIQDVEQSALKFFCRLQLEGLQIHSRHLRDVVNRSCHTLSLRRIHSVYIGAGIVCISSTGGNRDAFYDFKLPISEDSLHEIFRRISNSFVGHLVISFYPESRPFLLYARDNALDLHCQITALDIAINVAESVDYAMLDFLGRCLRPRVYALMDGENPDDVVMLFTRDAFRHTVSHLRYYLALAPAPSYIIAELLGGGIVETCSFSTGSDPRPWITRFIEAFRNITRHTKTVREVTLVFNRKGKIVPLYDAPTMLLCKTPSTEVPTPSSTFVTKWFRTPPIDRDPEESSTAKKFIFKNDTAEKKLEVFAWSIQHASWGAVALHYAYLLQIVDV